MTSASSSVKSQRSQDTLRSFYSCHSKKPLDHHEREVSPRARKSTVASGQPPFTHPPEQSLGRAGSLSADVVTLDASPSTHVASAVHLRKFNTRASSCSVGTQPFQARPPRSGRPEVSDDDDVVAGRTKSHAGRRTAADPRSVSDNVDFSVSNISIATKESPSATAKVDIPDWDDHNPRKDGFDQSLWLRDIAPNRYYRAINRIGSFCSEHLWERQSRIGRVFTGVAKRFWSAHSKSDMPGETQFGEGGAGSSSSLGDGILPPLQFPDFSRDAHTALGLTHTY